MGNFIYFVYMNIDLNETHPTNSSVDPTPNFTKFVL
jgi:hypothetical protein